MITKTDIVALADAIRTNNANKRQLCGSVFNPDHLSVLGAFLQASNPRFKHERWLGYIRGECGPNGGKIRKRTYRATARRALPKVQTPNKGHFRAKEVPSG